MTKQINIYLNIGNGTGCSEVKWSEEATVCVYVCHVKCLIFTENGTKWKEPTVDPFGKRIRRYFQKEKAGEWSGSEGTISDESTGYRRTSSGKKRKKTRVICDGWCVNEPDTEYRKEEEEAKDSNGNSGKSDTWRGIRRLQRLQNQELLFNTLMKQYDLYWSQ